MLQRLLAVFCLAASCAAYAANAPESGAPAEPGASAAPTPDNKTEFTDVYHTYQQLAANKRYADALPFAERAYQLGAQIYGRDSKNTAALALNLGDAQLKTGHSKEAIATLNEAVSLYEHVYGKDAAEMTEPLMARGDATGSSDPQQQRASYERALRVARAHSTPNDLALGLYNLDAGVHLMQSGSTAAARQYLEDAYNQYKQQLSNTDARFGSAAFWLGKYHLVSGDAAESEPYFTQALGALEREGVAPNILGVATHSLLVVVYEQLNDPAKATEQCLAVGRLQAFDKPAPLYRQNPFYPAAARASRQQGWVQVEFTIDSAGAVRDPKVVATDGSDTFTDAALAAIAQWRYAPRFVDGKPVDTEGIKVVLRFELEK